MIKFDAGDETGKAIYAPAMEIVTVAEAEQYLTDLAAYHAQKWSVTLEEARIQVLSNLGYFAGYYSPETFNRVMRLFGTAHPVFGTEYPTIK